MIMGRIRLGLAVMIITILVLMLSGNFSSTLTSFFEGIKPIIDLLLDGPTNS